MDKKPEAAERPIPDRPRQPNDAPPEFMEELRDRVTLLGLVWDDVVNRAEMSRTVKWRARAGRIIGLASARKIEEVITTEETTRGDRPPNAHDMMLVEWRQLGAQLMRLDPTLFERTLTVLREVTIPGAEARAKESEALRSILHSGLNPSK